MANNDRQFRALNSAQLAAVQAGGGPTLVVAGAGTGKTTVIVEHLCRLVRQGAKPGRLLALTFTEKAAAEMLDRVNLALAAYQVEMPVLTFNAFGTDLLRRWGADIGLGRNFTVMGESARVVFMRERLDELALDYFAPLSGPEPLLGDIADYFSRLKQYVITPEDYLSFVAKLPRRAEADKLEYKKQRELARAYAAYLRLCRQANAVDYDDQLYLPIELFRRRPNVLAAVRASYDCVMVDEFQDTNRAQAELIDLIVGGGAISLFVVGDDDQSIYGWRGATLANILDFQKRYPNAKKISLVRNYRSSRPILDAAYRLIRHNDPNRLETRLNIKKKLVTDKIGPAPVVLAFESPDEELAWLAEDIKKRLKAGLPAGDVAVMARRQATVEQIHQHLELAGVDHVTAGERYGLYQHPACRMLLEALKTVVDPTDSASLYHTLAGSLFAAPAGQLSAAAAEARRAHLPLRQAIRDSQDDALAPAKQALGQIDAWRSQLGQLSVGQLAYEILKTSGYLDLIKRSADPSAQTAVNRLGELFKTFQEFERVAVVPSAARYVEALPALRAAADETEDSTLDLSDQKVNVLTIHKAKGLEWPVVYIVDCTEGSLPLKQRPRGLEPPADLLAGKTSEADEHLAEERRLMYVAMTRARDELVLTHARASGSGLMRKPSRFLSEAFGLSEFPTRRPRGRVTARAISLHGQEPARGVDVPAAMLSDGRVTLTVSQAEKYLRCPLDFYYRYVLCVPEEPKPFQRYGILMHSLMEDINRSLLDGRLIALAELEKRLIAAWPKGGYLSAKQRDRARARARATLKALHARVAAEKRLPAAVEQPFVFAVKDARLLVRGRFDAVLPLGSGVEIVDYKTSPNVDTPQKAKSRAQNSRQLTMYALAWQSLHGEIPALVTLDFIETGQRGSIKKTERGLSGALTKLREVAEGIRARDWSPGRDHAHCSHPSL